MSNNLSEKIESCVSDMGYKLAQNIVLKTQETGMYILSQLSRGSYFHCINKTICIFSLITVRCSLIHGLLNIWTSQHNLGFTAGWSETVVSLPGLQNATTLGAAKSLAKKWAKDIPR